MYAIFNPETREKTKLCENKSQARWLIDNVDIYRNCYIVYNG